MRGQGRIYKRGGTWWIDYQVRGARHRESTGTTNRAAACELLRQRIGDRRAGKLTGSPDKVTFADLRALVERQYTLDGRRSLDRVKIALDHLAEFFGAWLAVDITAEQLDRYAEHRLAQDAARATINQELAALRRGFRLALRLGRLGTGPVFTLQRPRNARSGFFEEGEFAALLLELPADVRDLVTFLRAAGWRRDEGRLLTWAAVDMDGGTIRLEEARSKSGRARVFPFGLAPSLKALLATRWEARQGLYVFHRSGEPLGVGAIRSAWKRATRRAGLVGRLVHDLRRTAARDFRRAGVSEGEVMQLCGWETRAMFDRYNIIDEADLAAAVAKRFNGTVAAQTGTPRPSEAPLSSSGTS